MKMGTKMYFASALIVAIVFILGLILSVSFPPVSQGTATTVLENVIRLNGMLFGFSAIMLGLIFGTLKERSEKLRINCLFFSLCSFLSFLLSIYVSFSFLMQGKNDGVIFAPVILTCFGGVCASVYIVFSYAWEEKKE